MDQPPAQLATHQHLRTLCLIRLIPLAGMVVGLYLVQRMDIQLQWLSVAALLALSVVILGFTWRRSYRTVAITQGEFFGHLLVDIAIFCLLMYHTGGAANPFVSYLLVPITIAAITLPPTLTWLVGLICLASYTALLFWQLPLPALAPHSTLDHGIAAQSRNGADLHLMGMWLNFMVSALLIAYFVKRMARTIAEQERSLSRQQQQQLEDEQLLAVATLTASAAHELGNPLNTIKLISDDWRQRDQATLDPELSADLTLVATQVDRCQRTLQKLAGTARSHSDAGLRSADVESYFRELVEDWLVMRPDVVATFAVDGSARPATMAFHPALTASIHNLLNNAADASPQRVDIAVTWTGQQVELRIRDYGDGINTAITGHRPLRSDKPAGLGLGLFLARSILARHGGTISLEPGVEGTTTRVTLPMGVGHD